MRLGLSLGLTKSSSGAASTSIQAGSAIASNRTKLADGTSVNSNYVRKTRTFHTVPSNADYSNIQITVMNWKHDQNGESISGLTDQHIEAAIEYPVGVFTRVKFGGVDRKLVAVGDYITSNPVNITLPAGASWYLMFKHYSDTASTTLHSGIPIRSAHTEMFGSSTNEDLDVETTANMSVVDTEGWSPALITGSPSVPVNSLLLFGDSITEGYNAGDATGDAKGNVGAIERQLDSKIGILNLSKASGLAVTFADDTRYTRLKAFLSDLATGVITHGIWGGTTNDVLGSRGLATIITDVNSVLDDMRSWGMLASAQTLVPNTTSTDSWVTEVNQTPRTGFGSGEVADLYNADLLDGTITTDFNVFDLRSVYEGTDTNAWAVDGGTALTNDGSHINNTAGYAFLATNGLNLDWITAFDPFKGNADLLHRHHARQSVKTYTTSQAIGDVATLSPIAGSGDLDQIAVSNEPIYDNVAMNGAGALTVTDTSTMLILDTAFTASSVSGKGKVHYFIGRFGTLGAANYVLGLGNNVTEGNISSSLRHEADGRLRYFLQQGNAARVLLNAPTANDLYFYIVIDSISTSSVKVYINSTTANSFNPESELFDATHLNLFKRNTGDNAVVGMEILECGTLDDELSNIGITIQQIHDYANAVGGLGL